MLTLLVPLAFAAPTDGVAVEPIAPPELLQFVPAERPQGAPIAADPITVRLALDVAVDGAVTDVRVVSPVGGGFDEAAVAAARGFRFVPPTDAAGSPVPVTIEYDYRFTQAVGAARAVEGRLVQLDSGAPLSGLFVEVSGGDSVFVDTTTDADGRFALDGVPPGTYRLMAYGPGLLPFAAELQIEAGAVTQVNGALSAPIGGVERIADVIVVTATRPTLEITRRALDLSEITTLPGTNGDAVRVVQNLPGVARAPFNIGQLIIRGTAPEDSGAYLDGQRLPNVFHFGGLSTAVNSDLLEEVALIPGGYSVRYGRTLGGVVEMQTSPELPVESRSSLAVDVYQTTAFTQQKVSDRTAITLSARRSYIDAVLNPLLNGGDITLRAPRFFDFQARVVHHTPGGAKVDAMFFNSYDKFKLIGSQSDGEEAQAAIGFGTYFEKARLQVTAPLPGGRSETSVLVGPEVQTFSFGSAGDAKEAPFFVNVRQEFSRDATDDQVGFRFGLDGQIVRWSYVYDAPAFGTVEDDAAWSFSPAAYAEATVQPGIFEVTSGLRLDPFIVEDAHASLAVDPRLIARAEVAPDTWIKGYAGRFSQPPTARQVLPGTQGEPTLGQAYALQAGLGAERTVGSLTLDGTMFVSDLRDLVSGREDVLRFYTGPPPIGPLDTDDYANDGTGRVYGAELLAKYRDDRMAGILSLTLSRSTRAKRPGDDPALFAYDQPLNLTAIGSRDLGRSWTIGSRLRVGSGTPYTPVANAWQDLDGRGWVPVYDAPNSARLPLFYTVDVRFDKTWTFDKGELTAYLDVQNATNHANVDWMSWTSDYRVEEPLTGLPTLPTFGVKGSW